MIYSHKKQVIFKIKNWIKYNQLDLLHQLKIKIWKKY